MNIKETKTRRNRYADFHFSFFIFHVPTLSSPPFLRLHQPEECVLFTLNFFAFFFFTHLRNSSKQSVRIYLSVLECFVQKCPLHTVTMKFYGAKVQLDDLLTHNIEGNLQLIKIAALPVTIQVEPPYVRNLSESLFPFLHFIAKFTRVLI